MQLYKTVWQGKGTSDAHGLRMVLDTEAAAPASAGLVKTPTLVAFSMRFRSGLEKRIGTSDIVSTPAGNMKTAPMAWVRMGWIP